MNWTISLSREAEKFLARNHIERNKVFALIKLALQKFSGGVANVDIRKLKGRWRGFYRIRRGDLRVIASFDFDRFYIFIEVVDWRGNAYKE